MSKRAVQTLRNKPIKRLVPKFVIHSLINFDNSIINIKRIKNREQDFLDELLELGFDCRLYDTGEIHYVIENKNRFKREFESKKS